VAEGDASETVPEEGVAASHTGATSRSSMTTANAGCLMEIPSWGLKEKKAAGRQKPGGLRRIRPR
jgi:hypothetical protein